MFGQLLKESKTEEAIQLLETTLDDLLCGDEHGFTVLHWACYYKNEKVVQYLSTKDPRNFKLLCEAKTDCGDTPLHLAASKRGADSLSILHLLIDFSNMNEFNNYRNTPLHYSCFWNCKEAQKLLLSKSADIHLANHIDVTPAQLLRAQDWYQQVDKEEFCANLKEYTIMITKSCQKNASFKADSIPPKSMRVELQSSAIQVRERTGVADHANGITFQGVWNGINVFVTKLEITQTLNITYRKMFLHEIGILRKVNSKYVHGVIGGYISTQDVWLVSEALPETQPGEIIDDSPCSLYTYLHESQAQYSFEDGSNILRQLLVVIEYLVGLAIPSSLMQIKSKHIHIDSNKNIKLLMRFSRFRYFSAEETPDSKKAAISGRWEAPEEIYTENKEIDSTKSYIYSFGIVAYELFIRRVPFYDLEEGEIPSYVIHEKRRPLLPDDVCDIVPQPILNIIQACWKDNPCERPTIAQLQETLEKF
eukprot:Nk52_evm29s621 gene=Nk52_evmTU29s621